MERRETCAVDQQKRNTLIRNSRSLLGGEQPTTRRLWRDQQRSHLRSLPLRTAACSPPPSSIGSFRTFVIYRMHVSTCGSVLRPVHLSSTKSKSGPPECRALSVDPSHSATTAGAFSAG